MRRELRFRALGEPAPQGSMKPVPGRGKAAGRTMLVSDNPRLAKWRRHVAGAAKAAMCEGGPLDGALEASIVFYLARPRTHYTGAGRLTQAASRYPDSRPDLDKLERAIFDALKVAGAITDDGQIVRFREPTAKRWAEPADPAKAPGIYVWVAEIEEQPEGLGL